MKNFRTRRSGPLLGLLALLCMPSSAAATEIMRIGHSAWVADAPTRIAASRGEFEAAGVRVELREHSSGRAALASLLAEDVELALAAPAPIARALLAQPPEGRHGDDLVVLASVALTNRTHFILADGRRGIDAPADLEGRRIGLAPGTSSEFIWSRFVHAAAMDPEAFEIVHGSPERLRSLLRDGDIDAAVFWEPWFDSARRALGDAAVVFSTRYLDSMNWLLVSRREVVEARPEAVRQVLQGYRQAIAFIHMNPEAARKLDAEHLDIDPEALERMTTGVIWSLVLDGPVLANLEAHLAWLRGGRPPNEARLSPSRYLAAGPLQAIDPVAVRIPDYLWTPTP